jgi:hypothetical protein
VCVDSVEVWHDDKLSTPCCAGTSDKGELEFEFVASVDVNSSDCIVWLISPSSEWDRDKYTMSLSRSS